MRCRSDFKPLPGAERPEFALTGKWCFH